MAFKYSERVQESSTSTGTGNMVLDGAPDVTYQTFSSVFANGDTTDVAIFGSGGFESCRATYNTGANSITRGARYASSNGGAAVNFVAGPKTIIVCAPGALMDNIVEGALLSPNNLSEVASADTSRKNLHIGARGYISGLEISNNVADATNDIDIATGESRDSTNVALMVLSSAITKRLDATWAVGTGNGGLDTGSIANTTYHVHLIRRPDTGVIDAMFSTSPTSPTLPTNYTQFRRIGSIIRSGGVIIPFFQYAGGVFLYDSAVLDRNSTGSLSFGLMQITVPSGIVVEPLIVAEWTQSSAGSVDTSVWDARLGAGSLNCGGRGVTTFSTDQGRLICSGRIFTNASSQITAAVQATASMSYFNMYTRGFVDAL